jgi:phage shock protein A
MPFTEDDFLYVAQERNEAQERVSELEREVERLEDKVEQLKQEIDQAGVDRDDLDELGRAVRARSWADVEEMLFRLGLEGF